MPDLLLANDGSGRFVDVSREAGDYFQRSLIGRGSIVADLNNDGNLDVVVSNLADRPVLLRNDGLGHHWLTLDVVDQHGRKNPDGVSVWISAGGHRQHATTQPGTTFLSQSDRRLHFGLGGSQIVESIEITWPDGSTRRLEGVAVDQILQIGP